MDGAWRISYLGEETYRPPYGYDNRRRGCALRAVLQYTLEGGLDWHDGAGHRRVGAGSFVLFTTDEDSSFGLDRGNPGPYLWRALVARHGAVHGPDDGGLLLQLRRLEPAAGQRAVHGFVAELSDGLERSRGAALSPVQRAAEALAREPFRDWSVKALAASHRISREHLSEVFRQRFGVPPGAWLLERRLAYARELLACTQLPLEAIAARCGLGCARRLSRALKRSSGVPASRLR